MLRHGKKLDKKFQIAVALMFLVLGVLVFFTVRVAGEHSKAEAAAKNGDTPVHWIGSWEASPEPAFAHGISRTGFNNRSFRLIVDPHLSGKSLRIRLSNTFGSQPLTFTDVHVALSAGQANIVRGTNHKVTFGGDSSVTIPAGAQEVSDPVPLHVTNGHELAVSVYLPGKSGPTTWHAQSKQTTYVSVGNHTADSHGSSYRTKVNAWFWLDGIDVAANPAVKGAVVTLGDSITNVGRSTLNANDRYPDYLARRFNQLPVNERMSVLNAGISSNEILDRAPQGGVSALARVNRDVFSQTGVKDVILLEGINDIGHYPHTFDAKKIISGMKQIIAQAHAHHLKIYGGTLTPFKGTIYKGFYTAKGEKTREAVNRWIRTSHAFDGVIDFDKALRDPNHPLRLAPKYDSGDHLHPNDAGCKAMADAIKLSMFRH